MLHTDSDDRGGGSAARPAGGHTIRLGEASVTRVLEWAGPVRTVAEILPAEWMRRASMAPHFWTPHGGAWRCHVQTW